MGNCQGQSIDSIEKKDGGEDQVQELNQQVQGRRKANRAQSINDGDQPFQSVNNMIQKQTKKVSSAVPSFLKKKKLKSESDKSEEQALALLTKTVKLNYDSSKVKDLIGEGKIQNTVNQWNDKHYQNYLQIQEKAENQKDEWTDPQFEAGIKSLTDYPDKYKKGHTFKWMRAQDINDLGADHSVFKGISPQDIKQGALGDCYLLSSLAALAENAEQQLIDRLFLFKDRRENGVYGVWLCIMGEWQLIPLDNQFPCNQYGRPAYSKANGPELWVLLIEKAYAKVYGTYKRIEAGLTGNAIRDLTGSPYIYLNNEDVEDTWNKIELYDNNINIITAGSQSDSRGTEFKQDTGIISGHAYSILDHRKVTSSKGDECRIVKLRNPWGSHEWNGRFSDNSDDWTDDLKKELDVNDANDGIFWMPIEDYCQAYSETTINFTYYGARYSSYRVETGGQKFYKINFTVEENNNLENTLKHYIAITQKSDRWFEDVNGDTDYFYSMVRLLVFRKNGEDLQFLGDIFKGDRDIDVSIPNKGFIPGDYVAVVDIDWVQTNFNNDFVISCYGPSKVQFTDHEQIDLDQFENFIDIGILQKTKIDQYHQYQSGLDSLTRGRALIGGYLYFIYKNQTENMLLSETGLMKNRQLLTICQPHENNDQFDVSVAPGECQHVKYRVDEKGFGGYGYGMRYQTGVGKAGMAC